MSSNGNSTLFMVKSWFDALGSLEVRMICSKKTKGGDKIPDRAEDVDRLSGLMW